MTGEGCCQRAGHPENRGGNTFLTPAGTAIFSTFGGGGAAETRNAKLCTPSVNSGETDLTDALNSLHLG